MKSLSQSTIDIETQVIKDKNRPSTDFSALGKQILYYVPSTLIPAVVGLFSTVIFTRLFSSEEFGCYSLIVTIVGLFSMMANQWLQQGINRYLPGRKAKEATQELKRAISTSLILVGFIIFVLLIMSIFAGWSFIDTKWKEFLLPASALLLVTTIFTPLCVVLQADMRAGLYTIYRLVNIVFGFIISLLLVFLLGRQPENLIIGSTIPMVIMIPILWRSSGMPPLKLGMNQLRMSLPSVKRLASYGMPMVGWFTASTLLLYGDRYVIQYFRGASEVGIYSATSVLVFGGVSLLTSPIILAAHPFLVRAWDGGNSEKASRWLMVIVESLMVAGMFLTACTALFAQDFSSAVLGKSFREGYRIMPILVAAGITWQIGMYSHKPLEFAGRTGIMSMLCGGAALSSIFISLIFVPKYGYLAAGYTMFGCNAVYFATTWWLGRRVLEWNLRPKKIVIAALVTGIWFVFIGGIRPWINSTFGNKFGPSLHLAITLLTAFLAFILLLWPLVKFIADQLRKGKVMGYVTVI